MNNRKFLKEVVNLLEENNIQTWIFGGWAEEMLGIIKPGKHNDIDLLYPSENFLLVDNLLSNFSQLKEINAKHFTHKRAFIHEGVMIELFLLQKDERGYYTNFWGTKKYYWPNDVLDDREKDFRLVSKEALADYRKNQKKLRE